MFLSCCKNTLVGKNNPNSKIRLCLLFSVPGEDALSKNIFYHVHGETGTKRNKHEYIFIVFTEKFHNENSLLSNFMSHFKVYRLYSLLQMHT